MQAFAAFAVQASGRAARLRGDAILPTGTPLTVAILGARPALGLTFPGSVALAQVANQYFYVVYQRGQRGPIILNFFNGGDGWYRVGYNGKGDHTDAPSAVCDNGDPTRYCLSRGAASDWELLCFAQPGVSEFAARLFALAGDTSITATAFRRRVWTSSDAPFVWKGGRQRFCPLLTQLIGEYLLGEHLDLPHCAALNSERRHWPPAFFPSRGSELRPGAVLVFPNANPSCCSTGPASVA